MAQLKPEDVFTPASPTIGSKVYARRRIPETLFREILSERGTQVLVYGDSAIGKTSFVLTELRRRRTSYIRVQCESRMTWDQISSEILRILKEGIAKRKVSKGEISGEASLNLYFVGARLGGGLEKQIETELGGKAGTVGHITDILLAHNVNLVIDDFEKVRTLHTKTSVANLGKSLSDSAEKKDCSRIIVLGISDSADDLIEADLSVASRLHPLELPRMQDNEMVDILQKGFTELGIHVESGYIESLCRTLGGFPKYAHAIGLELSRAADAEKSKKLTDSVTRNGLRRFIQRYCAHMRAIYNKATVVWSKPKSEYVYIVGALAEIGLRGQFTFEEAYRELSEKINQDLPKSLTILEREKVRTSLNRLCQKERGSIFAKSARTGQYYYNNPLMPIYIEFKVSLGS